MPVSARPLHGSWSPVESSTQGPCGAFRTWASHLFRPTPRALRGPRGSSTECFRGAVRMWASPGISACSSHVSWPHGELH
eukprot:224254-Pyramimonas_sp.AAC.1